MRRLAFLRWINSLLALALLAVNDAQLRGETAWFLPLDGTASAISGDGSLVVGHAAGNGLTAVSWQLPSGIRREVDLPPDDFYDESHATDVSADGNAIVGRLDHIVVTSHLTAPFIWNSAEGMRQLPKLSANRSDDGWASCISGDGRTIIGGSSLDGADHLVEWYGGTLRGILPTLGEPTFATGISYNGDVVVGASGEIAVLWDSDRRLIPLGTLPGDANSYAKDVTPDGHRVLGSSYRGHGESARTRPFLWRRNEGLIELPAYPASRLTLVEAMSADSAFIVGSVSIRTAAQEQFQAAILGPSGKWRLLEDIVRSAGVDHEVDGWVLLNAHSVSADGKTIVGVGIHPDGYEASWVVHVPEPGSGLMLLIGIVFACHACRRTSTSMGKRWSATD